MNIDRTLKFLKSLKRNNNKQWFDAHRDEYEVCRADFLKLIDDLIRETSKFTRGLAGQSAKSSVFRINRDIRFSSDKSPYKSAFSAVIGPQGRKSTGSIYYIHIEPSSTFVASGVYLPERYPLSLIRSYIGREHQTFLKMVRGASFRKNFELDLSHSLKKVPAGFDPEHPAAEYLKLKSFTISHDFAQPDEKIGRDALRYFKLMQPFNQFLDRALRAE